jgi:hypothetical protein
MEGSSPLKNNIRFNPYSQSDRRKPWRRFKLIALGLLIALAVVVLAGLFLAPKAPEAKAVPTAGETPRLLRVEERPQAGLSESLNPTVASLSEDVSVRSVLEEVLSDWTRALLTGDFREFHKNLSPVWKSQDSPEKLASAYKPLAAYKEALERFPARGKLVILESAPFQPGTHEPSDKAILRDNLGPESPWLVRGEWRAGRTALNFTLILVLDSPDWKPVGLRVEIYERGASS